MEASLVGLGIKVTPGGLGGWVLDLEPVIGPEIAEAEEMTSQGIGQIRPKLSKSELNQSPQAGGSFGLLKCIVCKRTTKGAGPDVR
jgi:hypothetical protein